jgi:iron complex transport system substrate-binding protein
MSSANRIVSLLPSSTEIICALGLRNCLVGVSHECDYPADVVRVPVLTEPKLNPQATSGAIEARVRELVQEGLSIYRINTEALKSLQPDLIITQDQCEVCAIPLHEVEAAVRRVLSSDVKVVSLRPQRLRDIWEDISRVAAVTGREESAEELLKGIKRRLWKLEQKTRHLARPKVACLEWLDPLITAGNWIPELVSIAGGECTLAETGEHSTKLAWESLVEYQPDVIVLMPCGFKIAQTQAELPGFTARPQWQALSAVQNNKVFIVDGNAYLNRSGPRIVDSAEILAEILHPDACAGLAPADSYLQITVV